jgi:hypothetical protein
MGGFKQPVHLINYRASVLLLSGRTLLWGALLMTPERMHRVQTLIRLTAPSLSTRTF